MDKPGKEGEETHHFWDFDVGLQQRLSSVSLKRKQDHAALAPHPKEPFLSNADIQGWKQWPFGRRAPWRPLWSCIWTTHACYLFSSGDGDKNRTTSWQTISLLVFPLWKLTNIFGSCFCPFFCCCSCFGATGVCTNRITRGAARPCFRYSWYHIATACQLFYNEVEAWFGRLMWQWGKVEKGWR